MSDKYWYYVVYDRDGGDLYVSEEFSCEEEAELDAQSCVDDPRYGSHEVFCEDDVDE